MQCPNCKTTQLVMSERSGVEIDYCPQCRGVWLDRGELDKILERAAQTAPAAYAAPRQADYTPAGRPPPSDYDHRQGDQRQGDHRHHGDQGYYKKKKRESFLSDLFDF